MDYCFRLAVDEGRKEMFYLMSHSTHFILRLYGVKDHSAREETRCRHYVDYCFRLAVDEGRK